MMAIGLETVKLGIGKTNVIAVVRGVILKETVLTVQNPITGVNTVHQGQGHAPDHYLEDVEEVAVQVTKIAVTVDQPVHQGGILEAQPKMTEDQEVEATAAVLGEAGGRVQQLMIGGVTLPHLMAQTGRVLKETVLFETIAGVIAQHQMVAELEETVLVLTETALEGTKVQL